MSVQSSFFGVTKLTDEDSEKFRRQVIYGRANKAAVASLKRGKAMLRSANANGEVKLKVK